MSMVFPFLKYGVDMQESPLALSVKFKILLKLKIKIKLFKIVNFILIITTPGNLLVLILNDNVIVST